MSQHIKTKAPMSKLEGLLRENWDHSFTLKELMELGLYRTKYQLVYALQNSDYIYKVRTGEYQFTPVKKEDALPLFEQIKNHLESNQSISLSDLSIKTEYTEEQVKKCIYRMIAEGFEIKKKTTYSLY